MKQQEGIKNILIDLGGVLLDIDFQKTFDAFAALGIEGAHELNDRPDVLGLFMDLECGLYSKSEFLRKFREVVLPGPDLRQDDSTTITDQQVVAAFNALLLDFMPGHIELVLELRKKYRVFLLSNTNVIHAECYNARLKADFGIENLDHLMEKAFYSHDLKCRKPDQEIYIKALELAGIKPDETMFIDDNQQNVDAAIALGIRGIRVTDDYTILDVFGA